MTVADELPKLLGHAKQTIHRRNVSVGDLLSGTELHWAAMLTHGYINDQAGEREIHCFADLGIARDGDTVQEFSRIRNSGNLLEGEKRLPTSLSIVLLKHAGDKVWVRNSELPVSVDLGRFEECMRAADSDYEFEACAGSGEWYLRFRDDDAAIFIAASTELLNKLMTASFDCVLPIDASFLYAR